MVFWFSLQQREWGGERLRKTYKRYETEGFYQKFNTRLQPSDDRLTDKNISLVDILCCLLRSDLYLRHERRNYKQAAVA